MVLPATFWLWSMKTGPAAGDVPFHGGQVRRGAHDGPAHRLHEAPHPGVGVLRFQGHVDVQAAGAGGLGVAGQAEPVQRHLDQAGHRRHLLPGRPSAGSRSHTARSGRSAVAARLSQGWISMQPRLASQSRAAARGR